MKTWHFENAAAILVLSAAAVGSGADRWQSWVSAAAVFCAFCHASISERMRERQAAAAVPTVECHAKLGWFFAAKEVLFAVTFVAAGLWPLLAGSALFLAYPVWRRAWRRWHPMPD